MNKEEPLNDGEVKEIKESIQNVVSKIRRGIPKNGLDFGTSGMNAKQVKYSRINEEDPEDEFCDICGVQLDDLKPIHHISQKSGNKICSDCWRVDAHL